MWLEKKNCPDKWKVIKILSDVFLYENEAKDSDTVIIFLNYFSKTEWCKTVQVWNVFGQLSFLVQFQVTQTFFEVPQLNILSEPVKMVRAFCCQMSVYVAVLHVTAAFSVRCTDDCSIAFSDAILQTIEKKYLFWVPCM